MEGSLDQGPDCQPIVGPLAYARCDAQTGASLGDPLKGKIQISVSAAGTVKFPVH